MGFACYISCIWAEKNNPFTSDNWFFPGWAMLILLKSMKSHAVYSKVLVLYTMHFIDSPVYLPLNYSLQITERKSSSCIPSNSLDFLNIDKGTTKIENLNVAKVLH